MQDEFGLYSWSISGSFRMCRPSLNLSPLIAEAPFDEMFPSYFVLGIDKSSEDAGFSVLVGIHLKLSIAWLGLPRFLESK